jgi:hypothetical protein
MRRARPAQSPRPQPGDIQISQNHPAGGRFHQTIDAADQRALAGARGTDQGHDLALRHLERNAGERLVTGPVLLGKTFYAQHPSLTPHR